MIKKRFGWLKSYKPLTIGYTLSVLLTFAAYRILTRYHLTHNHLIITLFSFAVIQAIIQFIFFLHLGVETKPRWGLAFFLFTLLVVIIIIGGTLWIMANLDYNMMLSDNYR